MMNVLAISLVLTSLFAAAVWSPSPPTHHHNDHQEVIVKEGHRVVVVEYDKEADGSTKVLISPHDVVPSDSGSKDGSSNEEKPSSENFFSGPRELVCDAYGKCKHKIADALGKTRDKVKETVHDVSNKAREVEEHAKDTGHKLEKAKDTVVDKAKKVAGDVAKVKNLDVVDKAKLLGGHIESNVSGMAEEVAKEAVEVGEKNLGEILRKLKEVAYDVFWYTVSRDKVDAVSGLIHMLGFSTAYGMCVWVTFISSYILGRYLPKQQFAVVQSRIYPVYFRAMAYCVSAALLGHLASRRKNEALTSLNIGFQGLSLLSSLLMVLTNMIFLEPRATKTMYEKMKIEKEEGRGVTKDRVAADHPGAATVVRPPVNVVAAERERQDVSRKRLNDKLKRLNTFSSVLNVFTLVTLTWHMAYMGRRLHAATR